MRITKWGEYGILCALYLARRWKDSENEKIENVTAADIAEKQRIPFQYTQQILHRLKKGDIVKTIRGPQGGYRLMAAPEDITLRAILKAAEGDTFEVFCEQDSIYGADCDMLGRCGLKEVWVELKDVIDKVLEQKTLAGLLERHTFVWEETEAPLVDIGARQDDNTQVTSEPESA